MSETEKLNELKKTVNDYVDLMKYFINKIINKTLSEDDKKRYEDINYKCSTTMLEYFNEMGISNDRVSNSVKYSIEVIEDNIKNA